MKAPSMPTLLAFLAFSIREIAAQETPKQQLSKLPVCAQACITTAFATCKCKILDFTCACNCNAFRPFSKSCTEISCPSSSLDSALNTIDGTCKAVALLLSTRQSSSSSPTSLATSLPTRSPPPTETTTFPNSSVGRDPDVNTGVPETVPNSIVPVGGVSSAQTESALPGSGPPETRPTFFRVDTSRGIPITPTNSLFPGTTSAPTSTPQVPYSLCPSGGNGTSISWNGTTRGWNGSAHYTATYSGPLYSGFNGSEFPGVACALGMGSMGLMFGSAMLMFGWLVT